MKKSNIIDYYSSVFEEKAKGCRMYQFNIAFEGGRLDLVARSYSEFKAGVDGVNQTVKFAKMLQRLKFYIED